MKNYRIIISCGLSGGFHLEERKDSSWREQWVFLKWFKTEEEALFFVNKHANPIYLNMK